jgi:hypothetical protein
MVGRFLLAVEKNTRPARDASAIAARLIMTPSQSELRTA